MEQRVLLKIERASQAEEAGAGLFCFQNTAEAQAHLRHWLEYVCGLHCYTAAEEAALREKHGGRLPPLGFLCPQLRHPRDLEGYSGHYFYEFGGAVNLFVMAIWDAESARRFRLEATREFALDITPGEEAEEMLDMLAYLERSFAEPCGVEAAKLDAATEALDRLIRQDGLSFF